LGEKLGKNYFFVNKNDRHCDQSVKKLTGFDMIVEITLRIQCWLIALLLLSMTTFAQSSGQMLHIQLTHAPFPHPERANGHEYGGRHYPAAEHYQDSTVAIFVPENFRASAKTDLIVHFHGWWNNVDSVLQTFQFPEQLTASGKNALLLIPQGPKNAPDSFGGKLEDGGVFAKFVQEVMAVLHHKGIVKTERVGNIVLSGHSGGYRVIAYILLHGGLSKNVKEVWLFDGLYGQLEKYGHWLYSTRGRFLNIYTKDGGTFATTQDFIEDLQGWNLKHSFSTDDSLAAPFLRANRIHHIFTELGHNEVLHLHQTFRLFCESSPYLKR